MAPVNRAHFVKHPVLKARPHTRPAPNLHQARTRVFWKYRGYNDLTGGAGQSRYLSDARKYRDKSLKFLVVKISLAPVLLPQRLAPPLQHLVLLRQLSDPRVPPQPQPAVLRRAADGHLGALADGHELAPCLAQVLAPDSPGRLRMGSTANVWSPISTENEQIWRLRHHV